MTYQTAMVQLRAAQNGNQMLQVLDALDRSLTREEIMNENKGLGFVAPTLEAVEF